MKLNEEQIEAKLSAQNDWKREDAKWIVRKYRFSSFADSIEFVNRVAEIAERENHHPFILIEYKMVTLRMTSWNAGGLTSLDFELAAAFDEAYLEVKGTAES